MSTHKKKLFNYSVLTTAVYLSLTTASIAADTTATSEENDVEVVTVTGSVSLFGATKSNTPIVETARSMSIETLDDAMLKGALNLSQMLTYMPGVTAERNGFATRVDNVSLRGLRAPRYRDSIQEQFGNYNSPRAEIYTFEQVEVLRGPASVLYGQGSPGGIINYVSKTPRADNFGQINAQVGSFDRQQLGVDVNRVLTDDETLQGRFVAVYRDSGTQIDQVDDDTLVLMPSIRFAANDDTAVTLIGLYQDTQSDTGAQFIPVQGTLFPLSDGTYLDSTVYAGEPGFNKLETESTQITMLAEHALNDDFVVSGTALWRDGEADYHQAWPTFSPTLGPRYLNELLVAQGLVPPGVPTGFTDTTVPRTFYQADNTFEQTAFDIRLSGSIETGSLSHDILIGTQYQNVETDSNRANYAGGGVLQGDFRYVLDLANPVYTGAPDQAVFDAIYVDSPTSTVRDLGIYFADQIAYENWRITLGARYDDVENDNETSVQKDDAFSLSGGVLYKFDNGVSPYVNYAESFETVVGLNVNNEQLKPQDAQQIEVGFKYEPTAFNGFFTLAYFDIEINNLPDPNLLPGAQGAQLGESTLKGVEFEGEFTLGDFDIQLAYTSLDTEDQNGLQMSSIPDTQASGWITWTPEALFDGFSVGLGVRHMGETVSEFVSPIPTIAPSVKYVTPSYTLTDMMVSYDINEQLGVALNVRNLTDKDYQTSCLFRGDCFPGVRRTVMASVTYDF